MIGEVDFKLSTLETDTRKSCEVSFGVSPITHACSLLFGFCFYLQPRKKMWQKKSALECFSCNFDHIFLVFGSGPVRGMWIKSVVLSGTLNYVKSTFLHEMDAFFFLKPTIDLFLLPRSSPRLTLITPHIIFWQTVHLLTTMSASN